MKKFIQKIPVSVLYTVWSFVILALIAFGLYCVQLLGTFIGNVFIIGCAIYLCISSIYKIKNHI